MTDEAAFEGHAFHPSFGNEVAAGKLIPLQWVLRFESQVCELEMPFQGLEIHRQTNDGRITFRHSQWPEWSLYTFDENILNHRAFLSRTHLRNQIQAFARRHVWRDALAVTVACLLAFALLAIAISWASGYMVRAIAAQIPAAWEKDYGDKLFAELKEEIKVSQDTNLTAQLNLATEPLLRVVKADFQFHVVDDSMPNAFALPGGHVIVHTGLLKLAGSPEELAGVLAHEMAHVTQKHHFRQSIADKGPYFITRLFFKKRGFIGLVAAGSQFLLRQNFSRQYEREADDVAWRYLLTANINPRGEIDILRKLKAEEEKYGMTGLTKTALSSHPPTEERIQRLEVKWSKTKHQTGFMEFNTPE